jgi:hypothetical protein
MNKAVFVLCALAMLAIAPSALACADCVWIDDPYEVRPHCVWPGPAADCWEEWQTPEGPGGCYTTGRCPGGGGGLIAQLGTELTIASVEIRQDDSITTTNLLPVVAELPRRPADVR